MESEKFCERYDSVEQAKEACQCDCEESQPHSSIYCHCNYGNCCGYPCPTCGKFEVVQ